MAWSKFTWVENVTKAVAARFNNEEEGIQEALAAVLPVQAAVASLAREVGALQSGDGTPAPTIVEPGSQASTVGVAFELQIEAANATGYSATGLPAGLSISGLTGKISGTPTTVLSGSWSATAVGPGGSTTTKLFTWTVSSVAANPTLRGPGTETETGIAATSFAAPAVETGTANTDRLLMTVFVQGASAPTLTTPSGWTLVGAKGESTTHSIYTFTRIYEGATMPTVVAGISCTYWNIKIDSIRNAGPINVASGYALKASSTTLSVPSITTTVANTLLYGVLSNTVTHEMGTPSGWAQENEFHDIRIISRAQATAAATGAATAAVEPEAATNVLVLAIAPEGTPSTELVVALNGASTGVEVTAAPTGTVYVKGALCTALTGADEETLYTAFTPYSSGIVILGTESHPYVSVAAFNSKEELIGAYTTPRKKTTPIKESEEGASSLIIGTNGFAGYGPTQAKDIAAAGITGARFEYGGPYESISSVLAGGAHAAEVVSIVGNTSDSSPLSSVTISSWVTSTLVQVRACIAAGITLLEVVNEPSNKGTSGFPLTKAEPIKYAEMYLALHKKVEEEGLTCTLLFYCWGNYKKSSGEESKGPSGGWLPDAVNAKTELKTRIDALSSHPYGRSTGNTENYEGLGALEAQHSQAVTLGLANSAFYITESGFNIKGEEKGENVLNETVQKQQLEAYLAKIATLPWVKSYYYYSFHGDSTGEWGLAAKSETYTPRPSLAVLANYAKIYDK